MLKDYGIRGCVFDFDGTVVLSEHIHMQTWHDLSAETGWPLPHDFVANSVGRSDSVLVVELAAAWAGRMTASEINERKRALYIKRSRLDCELVPGSGDAIRLVSAQVPIALATNSHRAEVVPLLEKYGLLGYFKEIHTAESVNRPKPDPEMYLKACQSIGLPPADCLAFEDSPSGCTSARGAGMRLVTISTLVDHAQLAPAWFGISDFLDPKFLSLL